MKLKYYADAGHAWLAVKIEQLKQLGIADKISTCSYLKGDTAYLEEDCDAGVFLDAIEKLGDKRPEIEEIYMGDYAPIRYYPMYKPA